MLNFWAKKENCQFPETQLISVSSTALQSPGIVPVPKDLKVTHGMTVST